MREGGREGGWEGRNRENILFGETSMEGKIWLE